VQRSRGPRIRLRLRRRVLAPQSHQNRHLVLDQSIFLTAESGPRQISHRWKEIWAGEEHVIVL
jgi:hypothetical protein